MVLPRFPYLHGARDGVVVLGGVGEENPHGEAPVIAERDTCGASQVVRDLRHIRL